MSNTGSKLRCAIYTRKSSEEGLDQSFNSLDAQREACEAYIVSQASMGWKLHPELYDDGGISGGTMDRPALQRLLCDIKQKKIDVVVVYKIDRLTRSLMDFSRIVEIFDGHGVSFVSITQQFNTTTSMGRLTLNVLLSFAQFEREVTAERIRDKVAASKKKGMWMGGNVPLGYQARDRKLIVDEQEAETVRWLFRRYLDLKSLTDLSREAEANKLFRNERRKPAVAPFGRGKLHHLLTNPIYIGKVRHRDAVYEGEHEPIIALELFDKVQALLTTQAPNRRSSANSSERHLLGGLLRDAQDQPFLLAHAHNHGRRYRYYVSRPGTKLTASLNAANSISGSDSQCRLPSYAIEGIVEQQLHGLFTDRPRLSKWCETLGMKSSLAELITAADGFATRYATSADDDEKRQILRAVFQRISFTPETITFDVRVAGLLALLGAPGDVELLNSEDHHHHDSVISISVPIQIRRRGVESKIILPGATIDRPNKDPMLTGLIAKAHLYLEALTDGSGAAHTKIAKRLGVNGPDISRILPMAFLSPKITEAILLGQQPADFTIAKLTRILDLPVGWKDQHELLGL